MLRSRSTKEEKDVRKILQKDLVLRGWEKLPYAVVERPHNGVSFVDARAFEALSLCDGQIDLSLPIIDDDVRAIVAKLEEQGVVRPCEPGEHLASDQEYRLYQNRFVRTAHWSITGRCNYRCRHCYMAAPDAKLGELDHGTVMDLARQIVDCGILEVTLTGGEPLVRAISWSWWTRCWDSASGSPRSTRTASWWTTGCSTSWRSAASIPNST